MLKLIIFCVLICNAVDDNHSEIFLVGQALENQEELAFHDMTDHSVCDDLTWEELEKLELL